MACVISTCRRRRRRSGPSFRVARRSWRPSKADGEGIQMYDFAYQKPGSVADAVKALGADPDAKALAGGQTFIPVLKQRLNKPSVVIDLAGLGLTGIKAEGGKI